MINGPKCGFTVSEKDGTPPSYEDLCWVLCTLLDKIEAESDCEAANRICRNRFAAMEDHGLVVEFGGEPSYNKSIH